MRAAIVLLAFVTAACSRDARDPVTVLTPPPSAAAVTPAYDHDEVRDTESRIVVDFELFAPGGIDRQFDWQSLGGAGAPPPVSTARCAVYDHEITVNPDKPRDQAFGERSLRISNAVTSGCYGDQTFSARVRDPAGQAGATARSANGLVDYSLPGGVLRNHFEAEWTFASATPNVQQPGLEMVVSPARGDSHRMSWVQMADLPDGIAVTFGERSDPADPGAIRQAVIAAGLDRRHAHTIRLVLDFLDGPGDDVVRVYVDAKRRHVGASWETYYRLEPGGAAQFGGNPPAVNRLMFRTGSDAHRGLPGTPAPATLGFGFVIDDVRIATFSVPRSAGDCKDGGWRQLRSGDGRPFANQGDCVSEERRHAGDR